ncbi:MAG: ATP-grasp domain-containing protein [Desulfuromonadales bacterium]
MKKYVIKDFDSLKNYYRTIERPFFALNKYPYSTLIGIENFINNFQILAFLNSKEVESIAKKHKISFFMEGRIRGEIKGEDYPDMNSLYSHIGKDENRLTISILKDEQIIYRMSEGLVKAFEEYDWTIVGSDYNVRMKCDNKVYFNKILEDINLPVPPYMIRFQEDLDYNEIVNSLGEKIVIQFPTSYSGSGTFIINSREDFYRTISSEKFLKQKKKNEEGKIRITRYVNRKLSPVMGVCCTKEGIVYTDLYHQIIDAPEVVQQGKGTGVYCGNEWTSADFPDSVKKQAYDAAEKIGIYLQNNEGYKGYFGLDFVLDDDTKILYPIEMNFRLIGSFPV